MLLIGLLFALFTVGFVVPCLVDVARTPEFAVRSLTKRTWLLVIILLSVIGGAAWLLAGRPAGRWHAPLMYPPPLAGSRGLGQQEAFRRHPASRDLGLGLETGSAPPASPQYERPIGPDDDPEFLLELARRINGEREADNDA